MKILSENQLDEFPADAPVWMVINKSTSDFYLRIPLDIRYAPDIVGFLEKEDAEQIISLLKTFEAYQNLNLSAGPEPMIDVRNGAQLYEQEICIFDQAQASELLAALPEILENYKIIRP